LRLGRVTASASRVAAGGLVVLVLLASALPAFAADIYVGPAGSDANTGLAPEQAVKTIEQAAALALPGDTVRILGGTYVQRTRIFHSGTPGNPITFQPYGDGPVVLDGQSQGCPPGVKPASSGLHYGFWGGNVHDIVIEGLEIRGYCYLGIDFEGDVHRITIRNTYVHHNGMTLPEPGPGESLSGQGIYVDGPGASDILIERNVVTDNCPRNSQSGSGIAVVGTDAAVVRGNVSERNNGNGILVEDGTNVLVEGNVVRGNVADLGTWGTAGVWVDGGYGVTVRTNWLEGNVWAGIEVTDEEQADPYGYDIHDNVVVGGWYGIFMTGVGRDAAAPNLVYGNTLVDALRAGIWLRTGDGPASTWLRNTVFASNLVAQLGADAPALLADVGPYAGVAFDHDLLYRAGSATPVRWGGVDRGFAEYQTLSGWDAAGVSTDPQLRDPAAGDYHLLAGSPAVDVGAGTPAASYDFDGVSRPIGGGVDVGAYELGTPAGPVAIAWLTASPNVVEPGREVTLAWSVGGTTGVDLQPAVGHVPPVAARVVTPVATTTYALTADGPGGPVTAQVTVTVVAANPMCTVAESTRETQLRLQSGRLSLSGGFDLHSGTDVSPDTDGLRLVVAERTGVTVTGLLDVTLPAGLRGGPEVCVPADGWRPNRPRTSFSYSNRSGAVPPACDPASARGVSKLKLTNRSSIGRGLSVSLKGSGMTWKPTGGGDLLLTALFGDGSCAWTRFAPGTCVVSSGGASCRR
jgi:hypothetical protein